MSVNLLVFNPEHDYALADNHPHFVALRSAAQFAFDCAPFMSYLSDDKGIVLNTYLRDGKDFRRNNTPVPEASLVTNVVPWGWDEAIVCHLRRIGVADRLLPTKPWLSRLRELAHRRTTIAASDFIRARHPAPHTLPAPPECLHSLEEVVDFVKQTPDTLLKAPYSGNGRGHLYAHRQCTSTLLRQCAGVIKKQGCLLAEKQYAVVQDFAMEFTCHNGVVSFRGYSLFNTDHYGYGGNILMPDSEILEQIAKYVRIQELELIRSSVTLFLQQEVAPCYEGEMGVDMFVYQENGKYLLHPFVEVNLRKTMGMAAHELYARHCHPKSRGFFRIMHCPTKGGLEQQIKRLTSARPLVLKDGLWFNGLIPLNPVTEETQYAVVVELNGPVSDKKQKPFP